MPTPLLKNRVHTAKQQARKERIRKELSSDFRDPGNQRNVDVFVLSSEEVIELWIAKQRRKGNSDDEINRRYSELSGNETFQLIKAHASNAVALARDTVSLSILMRDFKRSGNILGEYRTTIRNGRKYIIFKGNHKLRRVIRGTFYSARSPKIIKFGIGLDGARSVAKSHVYVTVAVSVTLNGYAWVFDPRFGWDNFILNVSSDLVKAALTAVAGYLAYMAMVPVFSTAVIPIAIGVVVSIVAGVVMSQVDREGELTDLVIESMVDTYDEWSSEFHKEYRNAKNVAKKTKERVEREIVDFCYYFVDESGEWVVEKVQDHVEDELRRLARRIFDYQPRLGR